MADALPLLAMITSTNHAFSVVRIVTPAETKRFFGRMAAEAGKTWSGDVDGRCGVGPCVDHALGTNTLSWHFGYDRTRRFTTLPL